MIETKEAFESTCRKYQSQIAALDLAQMAARVGARLSEASLIVPFFEQPCWVSSRGVFDSAGKTAGPAVAVAVYTYCFKCPEFLPVESDWLTFREFENASPLAGFFTANTNRLIATRFSGKLSELDAACRAMGASTEPENSAYDLAVTFNALPKVPLSLRFNDRDDDLPAQSVLLFKNSAEASLDLQAMIILGTFLAGNLIQFNKNSISPDSGGA
jgi:hypothetical protein